MHTLVIASHSVEFVSIYCGDAIILSMIWSDCSWKLTLARVLFWRPLSNYIVEMPGNASPTPFALLIKELISSNNKGRDAVDQWWSGKLSVYIRNNKIKTLIISGTKGVVPCCFLPYFLLIMTQWYRRNNKSSLNESY